MTGRTPPKAVLAALRKEVGFRCPADGIDGPCGDPLLTWHHFDPPWHEGGTHQVGGMIALCQEHHKKADNGAYTNPQLQKFKQEGVSRADVVRGRFDWQRQDIVAIIGGNGYYKVETPVRLNGTPVVWFTRNESNELLLNYRAPQDTGDAVVVIDENVWSTDVPQVDDLISPPGGRSISISFKNGDSFKVEFSNNETKADLQGRLGFEIPDHLLLTYPVTSVELWQKLTLPNGGVELNPSGTLTQAGGITGVLMTDFETAVNLRYAP